MTVRFLQAACLCGAAGKRDLVDPCAKPSPGLAKNPWFLATRRGAVSHGGTTPAGKFPLDVPHGRHRPGGLRNRITDLPRASQKQRIVLPLSARPSSVCRFKPSHLRLPVCSLENIDLRSKRGRSPCWRGLSRLKWVSRQRTYGPCSKLQQKSRWYFCAPRVPRIPEQAARMRCLRPRNDPAPARMTHYPTEESLLHTYYPTLVRQDGVIETKPCERQPSGFCEGT